MTSSPKSYRHVYTVLTKCQVRTTTLKALTCSIRLLLSINRLLAGHLVQTLQPIQESLRQSVSSLRERLKLTFVATKLVALVLTSRAVAVRTVRVMALSKLKCTFYQTYM